MKIRLIGIIIALLLQACTPIDDYMLGQDNTPKPKALKEVNGAVKVANKWTVATGSSRYRNDYLKLKPVVRGSKLYTADSSGLIKSINNKDGEIQWSLQLKHDVVSGPTVANGYIAVSTNASTLILISQDKGRLLWEAPLSGEALSPPAIAHNKVIVKTIDGKVFAFDSAHGKQLWVTDHGSPHLILKASSSPIILGKLVLIGFSDGKLDALDIETGAVMWQRSIAFATGSSDVERLVDIDADPIIKGDIAYIASYQGYIGALSLKDGQFLWKKPGSVYKNMLLKNNALYITDSNDVVWSLDSRTGAVNWKQTALKARGVTEPVLTKKGLVVADKTGYLHVLDMQTGEIIARSHLAGGVSVSPNVKGKNVYILTENGTINQLSIG